MNRTKIEWCDWTSNPVKGYCPMACPYCYARRLYNRFGWDKTIRFNLNELNDWERAKAGDKVFVGSTIELFDDWISATWLRWILMRVRRHPKVIFIFLTKRPENLARWNPWPPNSYVGVTTTNREQYLAATSWRGLDGLTAEVKYLSFEPLLEAIGVSEYRLTVVQWVVIGAMTGTKAEILDMHELYPELTPMAWGRRWTLQPKPEGVQQIIEAADKMGIPVFLKDNLGWPNKRQEFPYGGRILQ